MVNCHWAQQQITKACISRVFLKSRSNEVQLWIRGLDRPLDPSGLCFGLTVKTTVT